MSVRPLALVTGASSGIGLELAKLAADDGYDLVIAADRSLDDAVQSLEARGAQVEAIQTDLATKEGLQALFELLGARHPDLLFANAGHGLGGAFLDQDPDEAQHVIDTNISGTVALLHVVGNRMREQGAGRILITGSIAGFEPGSYQAVYNGTKAFIDSFALALRDELKETGVSVSCLMPGVTDTEFFARAGLLDTKIGAGDKMDPAEVAQIGYDAMKKGEADVVAGWKNKLAVLMANVTPGERLAAQHAKMVKPGSAND
jgi:short-subunit dehydrogenase